MPTTEKAPTQTFSYRQRTFAPEDLAGQARALHEDGFALVPGVLAISEIEELRAAIDRLQPFGLDCGHGLNEHYKCVFNRERAFLDVLDRPDIVDLAEKLMGAECHIIGQTAWKSHPGYDGWAPHTDRVFVEFPEALSHDPEFKLPIYLCTAHYYLDDITLDLAPTWVIPASHQSGRALTWGADPNPTWQGRELEPVLCRAGDVLFFRSEIWHSGSKNSSAQSRYLLQVHYSHRWIAQQFSPYLQFRLGPETLAVANPRQRRLLGEHKSAAYD